MLSVMCSSLIIGLIIITPVPPIPVPPPEPETAVMEVVETVVAPNP